MNFSVLEIINSFIDTYTTEVVGGLTVAIILLLFNYISKFIKNLRISRKYGGYIGNYFLYSYSSTGLNKIVTSSLSIKTKLGKLTVSVDDNSEVYRYTGTMYITERNLYIDYEGVNHIERVSMIFHSPLHKDIKKLFGTSCSISPIDEPTAKYWILSDEEMLEEVIIEKLKMLESKQPEHILKVPRDIDMFFDNLNTNTLDSVYGIAKESSK